MLCSVAVRAIDPPWLQTRLYQLALRILVVLAPSVSLEIDHQPALQTSVLLVHAQHLSTLIEHGHVASVNQPRRAMASFKERLLLNE